MTTMTQTTARPSDLGFLAWNDEGTIARWTWRFDTDAYRIVQRHGHDAYNGTPLRTNARTSFRATIVCGDADEVGYPGYATLTTCGHAGLGGTRHRDFAHASDAVNALLAWLDRRYGVEAR